VTVIAVNIETKTPIARATAKPLTGPVPIKYKIEAVIKEEIFESLIEDQALLNPDSSACLGFLPHLFSSFILSKIKILASTAIPIDKINPAIPARVKVIGGSKKKPVLKIASTNKA
jgi:hypothetical protein